MCSSLFAQCFEEDSIPPPQQLGGGTLYESRHGRYMTASGTVRALVVLVELEYHPDSTHLDPQLNGNDSWPIHALPDWVDNPDPTKNLLDHEEPVGGGPQGMMTRYLYEASSGNFLLLADYLLAPDNGGIFSVPTSTGNVFGTMGTVVCPQVNAAMSGIWTTVHGSNDPSDYDKWTLTTTGENGPGRPKTMQPENPHKYDHVFFIFRNARDANPGNGRAYASSPGTLLGFGANTHTVFGAGSAPPVKLMCHEFCHLLFGGNNFHCAGGGNAFSEPQYWISQSGGWSLMGLANRSLDSWCGWDRLRMGWKANGQVNEIAARNATNTAEVNGDLDPLDPGQAGTYVLRDFVLTGDALRIRLPYTNPTNEYPEFIWVENHQGRNQNGHPFDKWQYEGASCVVDLEAGLFMYMQIDRDLHVTENLSALYGGYEDYLRPLIASGHYDIGYTGDTVNTTCICWECPVLPFIRSMANPLTGVGDTHWNPYETNGDGMISRAGKDFRLQSTEYENGTYHDNTFSLGHARHGFRPGHNTKLGIGSNPSSASMMNIVGANGNTFGALNHRRIQLNGISIELLEQLTDGNIKVQVRFDDVDIANDARWCAPEIMLNPVPTTSGHSLNVKSGKALLLDQGLTATRRDSAMAFNGEEIFTRPTLMRCTDQTWFNLESNSEVVVDNGSTLRLEPGSRLDVADGAVLRVKRGGLLEIMGGAALNVADGGKVLIEQGDEPANDGRLLYHEGATIRLEGTTSEVEIAGVLEIGENAVFQIVSTAFPTSTRGRLRFSSTRVPSENLLAGLNSRFIVRSDHQFRRVLYVDQESLYGPAELDEFALLTATAEMAPGARIVPPITNTCQIRFEDARVTAPSATNDHRGVRLNGQEQVIIKDSRFARGDHGLYAFNPTLGFTPKVENCHFEDCHVGFYSMAKGVHVLNSQFLNCSTGLMAEQVSQSSKLVECQALGNSTGVYIQGNARVLVLDPKFDLNENGLVLEGMDARVECGSVSRNAARGIHIGAAGTLSMDAPTGSTHDPVTVVDNLISISCQQANNVRLNLGRNSLRPSVVNAGNSLKGTFLCQTYFTQRAYRNNWEGTAYSPLTASEYDVVTNCPMPVPVIFVDPYGALESPCGQSVPPCPEPPCPPVELEADALMICPTCRDVDTDSLGTVGLNVASLEAKLLDEDDSLTGNELAALSIHAQVLLNDLSSPTTDEAYLLDMNYTGIKGSFSDALEKGEVLAGSGDPEVDAVVAVLTEVQDKRMIGSMADSLYETRLFAAIDKAQTYRAAGRAETAVILFDSILPWTLPGEFDWVSRLACLTRLERDISNGTLHWDSVEVAMQLCSPSPYKLLIAGDEPSEEMIVRSITCVPGIYPVPLSEGSLAQGFAEQRTELIVFDVSGRAAWRATIDGAIAMPAGNFTSGLYTYVMLGDKGAHCTGKLIVSK